MEDTEAAMLAERLLPPPREIRFTDGPEYLLQDRCRIGIRAAETAGIRETAETLCRRFWGIAPDLAVETDPAAAGLPPEGYRIRVDAETVAVSARDLAGVRYAFGTLRQLAEVRRGAERSTGSLLEPCEIHDAPAMPFRGVHFCIFPETPLWDIENRRRLAAYHKFNYAVIECWGVFPFESHPEFCWRDRKIDRGELKKLVRLGQELGITLIPQFNILGHATCSRVMTGKHFVLDFAPEFQPLFEPAGWSWCLTNPETRRILADLTGELHDFYEKPPFFHIGCDEAYDLGSCRECRRHALKDLVRDHILWFRERFAERGARVIMWHDMLLAKGDERWKGYIVGARPGSGLEDLYRELPRDIVIADWQYGCPVTPEHPEPEWPTVRFFADEKFDVLVSPWLNNAGTVSLGRLAASQHLAGMLATTWHIGHGGRFCDTLGVAPSAAWNPEAAAPTAIGRRLAMAHHTRQIGWDMGTTEYEKTGFCQNQVDPGTHPHEVK